MVQDPIHTTHFNIQGPKVHVFAHVILQLANKVSTLQIKGRLLSMAGIVVRVRVRLCCSCIIMSALTRKSLCPREYSHAVPK